MNKNSRQGSFYRIDGMPAGIKNPDGAVWTYEIKLDGYSLEVVKIGGQTTQYTRRANVLNQQFPYTAEAFTTLPDDTVIDGEVVAMR